MVRKENLTPDREAVNARKRPNPIGGRGDKKSEKN